MGDSLGVPWPLMLRAQLLSRRYPHERQLTVLSLPSSIPAPLLSRLLFLVECAVRYMANSPACHAPTNTAASVFICNVVSIPDSCTCFSTSLHVHADNTEQETIQRPCCGPSHCALHAALGFTSESTQPPMSWLPYSSSGGGAPVAWTTSNPAKTHAAVVTSPPYFATQRAPPRRPASSGKSPRNSSRPSAAGRRRLRRDVPHRLSWRAARRCSCAW